MPLTILCYASDRVARAALGVLVGLDDRKGANPALGDAADLRMYGTFRPILLKKLEEGDPFKHVTLGFLLTTTRLGRAIAKLSAEAKKTVLVMSAHPEQVKRMVEKGKDTTCGYAVFRNETVPLADIRNAVLITNKNQSRAWAKEVAAAIISNFVFPEHCRDRAHAEAPKWFERIVPTVG